MGVLSDFRGSLGLAFNVQRSAGVVSAEESAGRGATEGGAYLVVLTLTNLIPCLCCARRRFHSCVVVAGLPRSCGGRPVSSLLSVAGVRATRVGVTQPPSKPILSPTFSVSTASELDRKGLVCNFAVITLIQL